jgi:pimeloyl-ACP methyl ester carboxylesterase
LIAYTPGKAAVPRLIHLLATGQVARAAAGAPESAPQSPGLAYQLLIQCNEPWASWRPSEIKRLSHGSFLAPLFRRSATVMAAACAGFPKADVPAAIGQRVRSDVPILFLSGREDGADPPANIANARRELPNSRTVVFPAAGHGQLGLTCAQTLTAEFVARGSATGLDVSCARTAAVQPFDMPG